MLTHAFVDQDMVEVAALEEREDTTEAEEIGGRRELGEIVFPIWSASLGVVVTVLFISFGDHFGKSFFFEVYARLSHIHSADI